MCVMRHVTKVYERLGRLLSVRSLRIVQTTAKEGPFIVR